MHYNYLKVIIRNFVSDGMYSFIIIFGLAIGLAASLMITQYIHFEMSFDKHNEDAEDIYYTYMRWTTSDKSFDIRSHPAIVPLLKRSVPEVMLAARMANIGFDKGDEMVLRWGDESSPSYSREKGLFYADEDILKIFSVPFIKGNPTTALAKPYTVVLTRSLAEKLFPEVDPLNQIIRFQIFSQLIQFRVTGVVEDPFSNSSLQFRALFSLKSFDNGIGSGKLENNWVQPVFRTFIKLLPGAEAKEVEAKINKAAEGPLRKLESEFEIKESIHLYPLRDFHFIQFYNSKGIGPVRFTGDRRLILYFSILAILILVISWANYINLTTARALHRAKEVSVRKVNGASRRHIIWQFLKESLFMNLISLLLAFTIAQLSFGIFADVLGSKAEWILWKYPLFWVVIIIFLISSTIIAGIYPAFIISNYNPSKILKGNFGRSQQGILIRKGLVITQFVFAIFLLTSIYVISRQLFYLQTKDMGISVDQVLVISTMDLDTTVDKSVAFQQWKAKIITDRYVKSTFACYSYPGQGEVKQTFYLSTDENKNQYHYEVRQVSDNCFTTLSIQMLAGRDFNSDYLGEENKIVINDMVAHDLGFKNAESAIGARITLTRREKEYEVVGVVKSAVISAKGSLNGFVFFYKSWQQDFSNYYNYFLIKLSTNDVRNSVNQMEEHWKSLFGDTPFDYFFLDTYVDSLYKGERQFAGVFGFFSLIGVLITCMGLFGLSLYNTNTRVKEIGIRKTLGGSARGIMWLFSKEYLKLIMIAAVISLPIVIWAGNNWLKSYPNRIAIHADVALIPIFVTLLIAMFTVGYHTYKTAFMNPVKSLRAD
jgi:putative ABC transport system permease protein